MEPLSACRHVDDGGCVLLHVTQILSCKILVKISPVVSAENRVTDGNCIVVCLFCQISSDILDRFSPYESTLRADVYLYLIFQVVIGRGHGNQIILP